MTRSDMGVQNLPTPFEQLTKQLGGGLRAGELYVIGSQVGVGKTSLALQFVNLWAKNGIPGAVFSFEMTPDDMLRRMISADRRVDLHELSGLAQRNRTERLGPVDQRNYADHLLRMMNGMRSIESSPLFFFEGFTFGISDIRRMLKSYESIGGLRFLFIDTLQRIELNDAVSQRQALGACISELRELASEYNVAILANSHVSRSAARERRISLEIADLQGCGAIEESSAAVMLLEKSVPRYDWCDADPVKCCLKLAKNRYGKCPDYLDLVHHRRFTRFDVAEKRANVTPTSEARPDMGAI